MHHLMKALPLFICGDIRNQAPLWAGACISSTAWLWETASTTACIYELLNPNRISLSRALHEFHKTWRTGYQKRHMAYLVLKILNLFQHHGRIFLKMDWCLRRISDVSHISIFHSSTGPCLIAEMDSLHEEKRRNSVQNQQNIDTGLLYLHL